MSWDLSLWVDVDGHQVFVGGDYNYTHNTNRMVRDAGFTEWPYHLDGMDAATFCSKLNDAVHVMRADPKRFRAMDPENGWGSCDQLVALLCDILDDYSRYPSATVRCSA